MSDTEGVPRLARPAEPALITELSRLFWASAVTRVAVRKRVFTVLSSGPQSAEELADTLGTDPVYTSRLLDACAALGLLRKTEGKYGNSEASGMWLVEGTDSSQENIVLHTTNLWQAWEHLEEAITTGEPMPHERSTGLPDDVYWAQYMSRSCYRGCRLPRDPLPHHQAHQRRRRYYFRPRR